MDNQSFTPIENPNRFQTLANDLDLPDQLLLQFLGQVFLGGNGEQGEYRYTPPLILLEGPTDAPTNLNRVTIRVQGSKKEFSLLVSRSDSFAILQSRLQARLHNRPVEVVVCNQVLGTYYLPPFLPVSHLIDEFYRSFPLVDWSMPDFVLVVTPLLEEGMDLETIVERFESSCDSCDLCTFVPNER